MQRTFELWVKLPNGKMVYPRIKRDDLSYNDAWDLIHQRYGNDARLQAWQELICK